ncbi:hypothetical protein PGB90_007457 [Kerria lacca]
MLKTVLQQNDSSVFKPKICYTSEKLNNAILSFLVSFRIDIKNYEEQSYDNAR